MCRFVKVTAHGGALRATANRASLRSLAAPRSSNDASPPHRLGASRHRRTRALTRHAGARPSIAFIIRIPKTATTDRRSSLLCASLRTTAFFRHHGLAASQRSFPANVRPQTALRASMPPDFNTSCMSHRHPLLFRPAASERPAHRCLRRHFADTVYGPGGLGNLPSVIRQHALRRSEPFVRRLRSVGDRRDALRCHARPRISTRNGSHSSQFMHLSHRNAPLACCSTNRFRKRSSTSARLSLGGTSFANSPSMASKSISASLKRFAEAYSVSLRHFRIRNQAQMHSPGYPPRDITVLRNE